MKINTFSIKNYRSIVDKQEITLKDLSIIIGPNNEGKSNILNAITSALSILKSYEYSFTHLLRRYYRKIDRDEHTSSSYERTSSYKWERDFPIKMQGENKDGKTVFEVVFDFTNEELKDLNKLTGLNLNYDIIFTLELGKDSENISINYPANRRINLNKRKIKILEYVSQHIAIEYIGSVRTAERTADLIDSLIRRELNQLEYKAEYERLLKRLEKMQEPVLKKISKEVSKSIKQFLPNVKKVEVTSVDRVRRIMHESCEVYVDDGDKTPLELKGDGIKSLLAISLMQHLAKQRHTNQDIVFAIEEPKIHLHPDSIHKLKEVLLEISEQYQVILTTHSPIFVDRGHLDRNILVTKNKIKTVHDISEIRNELGIRVSDNLKSASLVILTEGENDIQILKSWLFEMSPKVRDAYARGLFAFASMGGCKNLSYQVNLHRNLICSVLVYLDADSDGKSAYEKAKSDGLLTDKEVFFPIIRSFRETEIEDLVKISIYKKNIEDKYGVKLERDIFKNNKNKWSVRIGGVFEKQGKLWTGDIEADVKKIVCDAVVRDGLRSLKQTNAGSIKNLQKRIEEELNL